MIRPPSNLLYANTAATASSARKAQMRKVGGRLSENVHRIGVMDISAHAGFIFDLLAHVTRRQDRFAFYPVEAPMPMRLGMIGDTFLERARKTGVSLSDADREEIRNDNVAAQDFLPFLETLRQNVGVEMMAGIVGPLLAFNEVGEDGRRGVSWGYFSYGDGRDIVVSSHNLREYAKQARRPFEVAVAMLTLAQVWAGLYSLCYHEETRGCPFDFCENRDDLVRALSALELCPADLDRIPTEEREGVKRCLDALRSYSR